MKGIEKLVESFREAINKAKDEGKFINDIIFYKFPTGCCGDSCYLLGHFLLDKHIETYYVCGEWYNEESHATQTHAWLLCDNNIIIDITRDQFKDELAFLNCDKQVYIGKTDSFYNMFKCGEGHKSVRIKDDVRLEKLYNIIKD